MSSNVFTLDTFREETIRRYAPTIVDLGDDGRVELMSMLKLRDKDREAVVDAISEVNKIEDVEEDDDETVAEWSELICNAVEKIFRLIAAKGSVKKLLAGLEHEDPQIKASLYMGVLQRWIRESQLGEAGSSPS